MMYSPTKTKLRVLMVINSNDVVDFDALTTKSMYVLGWKTVSHKWHTQISARTLTSVNWMGYARKSKNSGHMQR
jgi:hypothetical protein